MGACRWCWPRSRCPPRGARGPRWPGDRAGGCGGRVRAEPQKVRVEVEGRTLTLTNLDKVLYPEAGFTKGQVIDYYRRIPPVLLPHIARRPLTLKRYPD